MNIQEIIDNLVSQINPSLAPSNVAEGYKSLLASKTPMQDYADATKGYVGTVHKKLLDDIKESERMQASSDPNTMISGWMGNPIVNAMGGMLGIMKPNKFYNNYYQHRLRSDTNIDNLLEKGFKSGIGPNVIRASDGIPDNVVSRNWGARQGDKVLLVPKSAIRESGNGPKIKDGWHPSISDVVTTTSDNQPMYELYRKSILDILENWGN